MILFVLVITVLVVAGVLVPFAVGLIRGPGPVSRGPADGSQPMRPLGRVADLYVGYLVLAIVFLAWRLKDGNFGNGQHDQACVNTGISGEPVRLLEWRARPGTSLGGSGDLQACIAHPTAGQWALYALTVLPGLLLWCGVLLMIVRMVRHAAQNGPFTPHAATLMIRLGWLIVAGSLVAGSLTALGSGVLTNMVVIPLPFDPGAVTKDALVFAPLRALLPVPALAGAALLSFGRITRAGAVMDEELRATV